MTGYDPPWEAKELNTLTVPRKWGEPFLLYVSPGKPVDFPRSRVPSFSKEQVGGG